MRAPAEVGRASRLGRVAADGLLTALAVLLLAMVALSLTSVVMRYAFASAILWADEVASFGLIVLTWAGAIHCAARRSEIRMSILADALPAGTRRWLYPAGDLAVALLCGWLAWLSWDYVERVMAIGMRSDAARLPLWPVHLAVTTGLGAIAALSLGHAARGLRRP